MTVTSPYGFHAARIVERRLEAEGIAIVDDEVVEVWLQPERCPALFPPGSPFPDVESARQV
jgi:hypothetical protein